MLEKYIEQKLIKAVKETGGIAHKLTCPSLDGMPDRLVLLPKGKIACVELKAPGKKLRPLQEKRKRQLEELGFLLFVIDNANGIDAVIEKVIFHKILSFHSLIDFSANNSMCNFIIFIKQ